MDGSAASATSFRYSNEAIRLGTIGKAYDSDKTGGVGVRVSRTGSDFGPAVTVQRTRRSLPYYELDPAVRAGALRGVPLPTAIVNGSGPTFREAHPLTWMFGGDAAAHLFSGSQRSVNGFYKNNGSIVLGWRAQC